MGGGSLGVLPMFPLSIHSSGRYLVDSFGRPFFLHGDTPWSIAVQWTDSEITQYLNDRVAKGFNAIMFNAIEHHFSSQTPEYQNVDAIDPFGTMTDFASTMNSGYWNRVDHIVDSALALGILCIVNPAYLGFNGTDEGWDTEVTAESAGDLQTYGAALATRYTQGNVIWCMGGDSAGDITLRNKQWNIITGIRSVRTTDLVTGHAAPGADTFSAWDGFSGWGAANALNFCYPGDGVVYSNCQTSYGRAGPIPYFMGEAIYEQERGTPITAAGLRRQSYTSILEGACGQIFGNNPIWHGEAPFPGVAPFTYSGTWESNLESTGSQQQRFVKALFTAHRWEKLKPRTDTSLVTTSLGSGDSRVVAASADDGTLAMVWTPSQNFTVNMSRFAMNRVRGRWYDTTTGAYSEATGSPFTNSGTQDFTAPGERVLVLSEMERSVPMRRYSGWN